MNFGWTDSQSSLSISYGRTGVRKYRVPGYLNKDLKYYSMDPGNSSPYLLIKSIASRTYLTASQQLTCQRATIGACSGPLWMFVTVLTNLG